MLIAIVGTDGAGKSTQIEILKHSLTRLGLNTVVLDKWDALDCEKIHECRFISTPLRDFKNCVTEMDNRSRALFIFWLLGVTLKTRDTESGGTVHISDGYWMKHAASEIVYGADNDWIMNIVSDFPTPDLTLYIDIDPHVALARKKDFTSYECGKDNTNAKLSFLNHQFKIKKILNTWCTDYKWTRIDAGKEVFEVQEAIMNEISSLAPRHLVPQITVS
ncbi:hypothetical protein FKG94_13045 [Exilibacterium tricleocarpae]|uniref:Thymidylate kinase-like domain-containing protein n=1 Tax=Exilibacterium tricleocarpae TaxID=2591008 RepID=A0A545TNZ7_9GAMM|nr:hypothetical protein [Exilibacterium tricleocarpae]TQV78932.1 hypothetical protein FKG94_13045 [Exilibacterium tricleocarpae]